MWVELSKILPYLLYPLSIVLLMSGAAGVVRWFGARRLSLVLIVCSIALLLVSSNPWLAHQFRSRLEHWYPPMTVQETPRADAIVILGGALDLPLPPRLGAELNGAADRVLHGARLFRAGKAPLVIVTGGNVFDQGGEVRGEAWYMTQLLVEWGVSPAAIVAEEQSRNTRDNATQTRLILDRLEIGNVLLVTSAMHMPRALATFAGAGINAVPVPVDFTASRYRQPLLLDLLPSAFALAFNTQTLREHLGILVYGLRGWLARL